MRVIDRRPSMLGSFALGFVDFIARTLGIISFFLSIFAIPSGNFGFWFITGCVFMAMGSYAKYVSGHSVRIVLRADRAPCGSCGDSR